MSMLGLQSQQLKAIGHDLTDNNLIMHALGLTKRVHCYDDAALPGIG